ncbi:hypothetical protein NFJ02_11g07710 [Pycnococcus provasolii]
MDGLLAYASDASEDEDEGELEGERPQQPHASTHSSALGAPPTKVIQKRPRQATYTPFAMGAGMALATNTLNSDDSDDSDSDDNKARLVRERIKAARQATSSTQHRQAKTSLKSLLPAPTQKQESAAPRQADDDDDDNDDDDDDGPVLGGGFGLALGAGEGATRLDLNVDDEEHVPTATVAAPEPPPANATFTEPYAAVTTTAPIPYLPQPRAKAAWGDTPRGMDDPFSGMVEINAVDLRGGGGEGAAGEEPQLAVGGERPSHMAKRKHQLGSLMHDAQRLEASVDQKRARANNARAITRGKYGW